MGITCAGSEFRCVDRIVAKRNRTFISARAFAEKITIERLQFDDMCDGTYDCIHILTVFLFYLMLLGICFGLECNTWIDCDAIMHNQLKNECLFALQ